MPGGARLIVLLAACLAPAPSPLPGAVSAPIDARGALTAEAGAVIARGRVVGACAGVVRVEFDSRSGEVLGRGVASGGSYLVGPMEQTPARVRWGCDADGDGVVPAPAVTAVALTDVPLTGAVLVLPEAPPTR